MDGGEWFLSPDAIAIDQDWKLVNGQHRLMAVIKADMGQEFLVILNVSRRMGKVCDQGRNRNVRDLLHFQGLQVNSQVPTIMNSALMRHFGGTLDKSKCAVWYNKYSDCFEFASNLPYKKPVNYAQYKGAMACAAHYYKLPSERALLTRFAQAMAGAGDSTNKRDRLVISWRQKIIDSHSRFARLANSQSTRPLLLVKFQTILKYYMEGKSRLPDFVFQTATEKLLGKNLPEVFPLN